MAKAISNQSLLEEEVKLKSISPTSQPVLGEKIVLIKQWAISEVKGGLKEIIRAVEKKLINAATILETRSLAILVGNFNGII